MNRYGPCMCGATDCPSCGPAQGYEVVRVWDYRRQRWVYKNTEDLDPRDKTWDDFPPDERGEE